MVVGPWAVVAAPELCVGAVAHSRTSHGLLTDPGRRARILGGALMQHDVLGAWKEMALSS